MTCPTHRMARADRELKRLVFPAALAAMLVTIATAAGGAGTRMQPRPWEVHFALAIAALVINLWAFRLEYRTVTENAGVLEAVLGQVDRIRAGEGVAAQ